MPKTTTQKSVPDISFLVTANKKPAALGITLQSLQLQKGITSEILVSNNSYSETISEVCRRFKVREIKNNEPECYSATNLISKQAKGRYLCFPSEEDYYTPVFGAKLLHHATRFKLHLVYCDCVYDSRYIGSYEVVRVQPLIGHIDKGGFLVRRNLFKGWPGTPDKAIPALCDGMFVENLRSTGISFGKIPEVLWVHN